MPRGIESAVFAEGRDEAVLEEIMSEAIRPLAGSAAHYERMPETAAIYTSTVSASVAEPLTEQSLLNAVRRIHDDTADAFGRLRYNPGRSVLNPLAYASASSYMRGDEAPVWASANGSRHYISDMETSHIRNTVAYLAKRMSEWRMATDQAMIRKNFSLGPLMINSKEAGEWFDLFIDELDRREQQL